MFELNNVENKVKLSCEITGYQFPDIPKDDWCFLRISVQQDEQVFEHIDPALETQDLVKIYDWFECLSKNQLPRLARLAFIEPCIEFEFLAYYHGVVRICVQLSHELKPLFALKQFQSKSDDWQIVFELSELDFKRILVGIGSSIEKYPIRSEK